MDITLVIGNKNFSSWSMRPWLALKATGVPFREIIVPLRTLETKQEILRYSPSGQIPLLRIDQQLVWDSLAICETIAELFPAAQLWPADPQARAHARSLCAEMHSGFAALRSKCPMEMKTRTTIAPDADVAAQVERIQLLWQQALNFPGRSEGPFLYGAFGIADAFYAPVVSRFVSYGIAVTPSSQLYMETVWNHPHFAEWYEAALQEG